MLTIDARATSPLSRSALGMSVSSTRRVPSRIVYRLASGPLGAAVDPGVGERPAERLEVVMPAAVLVAGHERRDPVARPVPGLAQQPGEGREMHVGLRTRRLQPGVESPGADHHRFDRRQPPAGPGRLEHPPPQRFLDGVTSTAPGPARRPIARVEPGRELGVLGRAGLDRRQQFRQRARQSQPGRVHRGQAGRFEPIPPLAPAQDRLRIVHPEPGPIAARAIHRARQIGPEIQVRRRIGPPQRPGPAPRPPPPRPSSPADPDSGRSPLHRCRPSAISHPLICRLDVAIDYRSNGSPLDGFRHSCCLLVRDPVREGYSY